MYAADLLIKAIIQGGPYAVSAIGWLAWWYERRLNRDQGEKLFDLATAQVEATVKHEAALHANTKLMERLIDR